MASVQALIKSGNHFGLETNKSSEISSSKILRLENFLKRKPRAKVASEFIIRRMSGKIEVTIRTSRPGLVIGKKGAEIEILKDELRKLTGKEVWVEIEEIKRPDYDAQLVADGIARQLERRVALEEP